jgi:hypothetical protein
MKAQLLFLAIGVSVLVRKHLVLKNTFSLYNNLGILANMAVRGLDSFYSQVL